MVVSLDDGRILPMVLIRLSTYHQLSEFISLEMDGGGGRTS